MKRLPLQHYGYRYDYKARQVSALAEPCLARLVVTFSMEGVVRTALEGFATGHFASQAEVQRFLESNPHYPKDQKNGKIRPMTISRLLKKVV